MSFEVANNNASTENNGKGYLTYCSRCGAEMYSNARYCMKCGNLNPDHPDNKGVSKYLEKKSKGYTVGSGQSLKKKELNVLNKKVNATVKGEHTGNFTLCFTVNMILYLVICFGCLFYYYLLARGDFVSIIVSNLGEIILGFSVFFFYVYSIELVFMKMNKCWWYALIPFYNFYVLADAVIGSPLINKLIWIPVIGQVLYLYVLFKLGPCFKKPGILVLLLPFIMIPWIAFDGSAYYGTYYTSGENRMEDEFHMRRVFLFCAFFLTAVSAGTLAYTNSVQLKNQAGKIENTYIVNASNIIIRNVKKKVEKGAYTCDFDEDVFYFHFDEVSDYFIVPFAFSHPHTEAYVKVEKVKNGDAIVVGKYNYSISITDGKYGFPEIYAIEINIDKVGGYTKLEKEYDNGNDCYLHEKS